MMLETSVETRKYAQLFNMLKVSKMIQSIVLES